MRASSYEQQWRPTYEQARELRDIVGQEPQLAALVSANHVAVSRRMVTFNPVVTAGYFLISVLWSVVKRRREGMFARPEPCLLVRVGSDLSVYPLSSAGAVGPDKSVSGSIDDVRVELVNDHFGRIHFDSHSYWSARSVLDQATVPSC